MAKYYLMHHDIKILGNHYKEEEHDCKSCEFASICMLLDILSKDKK